MKKINKEFINFNNLRARYKGLHPRTRNAHLNTALGLILKGGSMIISLLLVPITIDYLDRKTYGTWLTISSITTMLAFLDIGIGNGLRNKFTEAITNNDAKLAKSYVSTSYISFGVVQLLFLGVFLMLFQYIPWNLILNTNIDSDLLKTVILISVVSAGLKLVLDLLSSVLFAIQQPGLVNLIVFMSNLLTLIGVNILSYTTESNLIYLSIVVTSIPFGILMVSSLLLYKGKLKLYKPSIRIFNPVHLKSLFSLGYQFFILQLAVIVIFYSDNLIISQLFGPTEVTTYNVSFRYFNAISTLFAIAIAPYWSAFTEAFLKVDTAWMLRTYNFLIKLWICLILIIIVMILLSDFIYSFWVGTRIQVPFLLSIFSGLSVIVSSWNSINSLILNGIGKIRLQLIIAFFCATINVPLAILLGLNLHMSSAGVVLATSLSLLTASFLGAIQVKKIIKGQAIGLWNK